MGGRSRTPTTGLGRTVPCHHHLGASLAGQRSPHKAPLHPSPRASSATLGAAPPPSCSPTPGGPPSRGDVGSPGGSSTPRGCRAVESPCSWKLAAFPSARLPKHVGGRQGGRRPASSCAGLRLSSPRGGSRLLSLHGACLTQGSGPFSFRLQVRDRFDVQNHSVFLNFFFPQADLGSGYLLTPEVISSGRSAPGWKPWRPASARRLCRAWSTSSSRFSEGGPRRAAFTPDVVASRNRASVTTLLPTRGRGGRGPVLIPAA